MPTAEEPSQSATPREELPPPTPARDGQGSDQHYVYLDFDDDNFGSGAPVIVVSCEGEDLPNLANQNGDCDDLNPHRFPNNPEVCDGWDNDCSGAPAVDEVDKDKDRYLMCTPFVDHGWENTVGNTATGGDDCDDGAGQSFPGNQEIPDGRDNDCDGIIDETP